MIAARIFVLIVDRGMTAAVTGTAAELRRRCGGLRLRCRRRCCRRGSRRCDTFGHGVRFGQPLTLERDRLAVTAPRREACAQAGGALDIGQRPHDQPQLRAFRPAVLAHGDHGMQTLEQGPVTAPGRGPKHAQAVEIHRAADVDAELDLERLGRGRVVGPNGRDVGDPLRRRRLRLGSSGALGGRNERQRSRQEYGRGRQRRLFDHLLDRLFGQIGRRGCRHGGGRARRRWDGGHLPARIATLALDRARDVLEIALERGNTRHQRFSFGAEAVHDTGQTLRLRVDLGEAGCDLGGRRAGRLRIGSHESPGTGV